MPSDTNEIIAAAEKLGQLVAQHPAIAKYKDAQKAIAGDPEASRLMTDFGQQLEKLARQEQSGVPITDAQRQQLESIQSRIASNLKVKALNMAEVDFTDLLRKVSQAWQKPLAAEGGANPPQRGRRHDFSREETIVAYWLLKTEPSCYSWNDLTRDRKTTWDGVTNAQALIHLRNMKKGDLALVYHTGDERAAVGIARVSSNPHADPDADNPRIVVVDLKPNGALKKPVTLETIKSDPAFAGWDLIRNSRLSVMPVPAAMWKRIEALSKGRP